METLKNSKLLRYAVITALVIVSSYLIFKGLEAIVGTWNSWLLMKLLENRIIQLGLLTVTLAAIFGWGYLLHQILPH